VMEQHESLTSQIKLHHTIGWVGTSDGMSIRLKVVAM
jgi:hypothetical protein